MPEGAPIPDVPHTLSSNPYDDELLGGED